MAEPALAITDHPTEPRTLAPLHPVARPPASRRLQIPPYELEAALTLERELEVSHVLAQVLVRRGLADPAAAREFIAARVAHDPSQFAGIERALALIRAHIAAGDRITIHGDYDVDGVCAAAIMFRALRVAGRRTSAGFSRAGSRTATGLRRTPWSVLPRAGPL